MQPHRDASMAENACFLQLLWNRIFHLNYHHCPKCCGFETFPLTISSFAHSDNDEWICYTTLLWNKLKLYIRRSSKFSAIGSPCWSCNLVLLGLIFLLKPKGNICIFLPGLNMSKSGLSQKERETNRIQMWHLALHHVRPNLRSQTDYRGAMSQHF